ncbi:MAG: 3'(2'),5'-bisphosphate nucleotidase CysQ [Alphaproteobacteria bacterium CG_4_10_14_0_2_um_filter_63_37]|nr:MAG: hypothetical protein AUJ55_01775 [Proteobacteria bacterium CG1_02_64_396]PJA24924.1 MAG: 3'(2'),5'-bisphosphate nucleotidase CysQ [Alphaproteobacteria bacterium CG_4_10_14_0_2_um_filter_63_37]
MLDLHAIHQQLLPIIRQAGAIVQSYAHPDDMGVSHKDEAGKDPLTLADLAVDRFLHEALGALLPEAGWLSEETADDTGRLDKELVWIVDPIDGTKEFTQQIPEYGVSIALAQRGQPVIGAVFNPATDELFHAHKGAGAWLNDQPIQVSARAELAGSTCLFSRSEAKKGLFTPLEATLTPIFAGSIAVKLAWLAAGRSDTFLTLVPKNEWDYAAGILIVEEAGGRCSGRKDVDLILNQARTKRPHLIASNGVLHEPFLALLENVPDGPDRR